MLQKIIYILLIAVLLSPAGVITNNDYFKPKPKYMLLGRTSSVEFYKEVVLEEFGKDFIVSQFIFNL